MAYGSGYPAFNKSGAWTNYNNTIGIYCKTNSGWVAPKSATDIPQVWSLVGNTWVQIYYKKQAKEETKKITISNNNITHMRSGYPNNNRTGVASQGYFDGWDNSAKQTVHPKINSSCLGLCGSEFSKVTIGNVTKGTVSFLRTGSGFYNKVNKLCFKSNATKKNPSAYKTKNILFSFSIPANGPNSNTNKAFKIEDADALRTYVNKKQWLYVSNNETSAGGNSHNYGSGHIAYYSDNYLKAKDFNISFTFTVTVVTTAFDRDETISPFSTKSNDNYKTMLIREDEIGMTLGEIMKYREENNLPDIDPDEAFMDDEMAVYEVGEEFINGTFEIAFPNVYEKYQKVFISYIDTVKDKEIRKEMLIHPNKGKHFAIVPDYVDEVTVEVIDTKTLTQMYKRTFNRKEI